MAKSTNSKVIFEPFSNFPVTLVVYQFDIDFSSEIALKTSPTGELM